MAEFNTSSDLPLVIRGGNSKDTAVYNRIATVNRINYLVQEVLPSFDMRSKSDDYLFCFDLEMWKRFYEKEHNKLTGEERKNIKVNEEFCQRAKIVLLDMEKQPPSQVDITELTKIYHSALEVKVEAVGIKKVSFIEKIKGWFK